MKSAKLSNLIGDRLSYILLTLALVFYIFQPPIVSRLTYAALSLLFVLFTFILFSKRYLGLIKRFVIEIVLFSVIVVYCLMRDLFASEIIYSDKALSVLIQCLLAPISILIIFGLDIKQKLSSNLLESSIFASVLLVGITPLIFFVFPEVNEVYETLVISDPSHESISARFDRGIGFSENLTFSFAYILGIAIAYMFVIKFSPIYLMLIPTYIFGIMVNARIGFMAVIFSLALTAFKSPKRIMVYIIGFVSVAAAIYLNFELDNKSILLLEWVIGGFSDLANLVSLNFSEIQPGTTVHVLVYSSFYVPENLIFGDGVNLFESVVNSDIGYVTQLNYGGILFLGLIVLSYAFMLYRLHRIGKLGYGFLLFILASILILNFKGSFYSSIPASRLFFIVYMYLIIKNVMPIASASFSELYESGSDARQQPTANSH